VSTLAKEFGNELHVTRFNWWSWNQASARLRAAERLKIHLEALISVYPTAHHYVIAHSHGGNVAMYALQDEALGERLQAWCASPRRFCHVLPRERDQGGGETLTAAIAIAGNSW
jgi:alpha-beta hydrolase superfamily lysophospholipase